MKYQVALFQRSWAVKDSESSGSIMDKVLNDCQASVRELQLPEGMEGNLDEISYGVWLKARTDRPGVASTTTGFVSLTDKGLHLPIPFPVKRAPLSTREIRLLEILPGSASEPLQGRIVHVKLDQAATFQALSYTWGSPEAHGTVEIDGHPRPVTKNLHAALLHLRHSQDVEVVWVDALCIDQTDLEERSQQVQIMGDIFSNAVRVTIWLGDASPHSSFGIEVLRCLAARQGFSERPPWVTQPPELTRKGLIDILQRPWFHRIWTVQEAALSSSITTFVCGPQTVSWTAHYGSVSSFIRGLKYAAISSDWADIGLAGAQVLGLEGIDLNPLVKLLEQQLRQRERSQNIIGRYSRPDLLDLAYDFRDKLPTDPRDKVYALLALAEIQGLDADQSLRPDYTKPWREVCDDLRQLLLQAAMREETALGTNF